MTDRRYLLKIRLLGIEPEIWRRFIVPGSITLDRLHDVIQIVMGWEDYHLHAFTIGKKRYTEFPESEAMDGAQDGRFRLVDLIKQKGRTFGYEYDFGDGWEHEITIEDNRYFNPELETTVACIEGERACPPEDVGGVRGYYEYYRGLIDPDSRREILDLVFPYIESGNSGMDDVLYDIAYAACYDDVDLHRLAESFEALKGDWQIEHARRIYKRLGCRNKYLELRKQEMVYGADYHDLATFYWETSEKEKALKLADKGLRVGEGRMDELREFLASRAEEVGDREKYLALQFAQTMDRLTLDKYKAFKKRSTSRCRAGGLFLSGRRCNI